MTSQSGREIAKKVEERARELLPPDELPEVDGKFVKRCLDANERGDGILFSTLFKGKYLQNVTPRDKEWFAWRGHVWERDLYSSAVKQVEHVALEYQRMAEPLKADVERDWIDKKHPDAWKLHLLKKYNSRIDRLRSKAGANSTLFWAPIVSPDTMAAREEEFNQHPWLLPVKNGVIDLQAGVLTDGRPEDLMTKALDVEYDPDADYSLWEDVLREITGSDEIPGFLKRSFGYAATGFSHEQYIWVFIGPGRNGKGIIFNLISEVLGPFFHTINPAMLLEQRTPPSPAAASEHLHSLLGKRLIVGSETNRGKKIDGAAIKELTGEDEIVCRPNFSAEITFYPTHTLMLRTNNVPLGMTQDFALRERLLLLDFPYRYVDDVEKHRRKDPLHAAYYRQKDKDLKQKLRAIKPGILRWIVEGCLEWQQIGLSPPSQVLDAVEKLSREEDYIGQFAQACLESVPDELEDTRLPCKAMYQAFEWWWSENEGGRSKRMPSMKIVNKGLRERGFVVDRKGGVTWIFGCRLSLDVVEKVEEFVHSRH